MPRTHARLLALLAMLGMLQLATAARGEATPEPAPSPVDEAAGARVQEVFELLIDGKTSEARQAVEKQLKDIDRLTPYEQGCIHLTSAWVSQWESRYDEAAQSFEKGLALGEAPADRPGVMSIRGLLLELYRKGAADPERTEPKQKRNRQERSRARPLDTLPPTYPQEPDHWPDGLPGAAPIDT
jgi:hypothetical protein